MIDHNRVLDMWAAGWDAPSIADRLGIERWQRVNGIICAARYNGDPRAVRRAQPQRIGAVAPPAPPKRVTGRRLMSLAFGIEAIQRMVPTAGYCSTVSGRKPVSLARVRCMEAPAC